MNTADLARLELAKRAYRATEPNAAEVQRGVRKARLALQRPRARKTWFSKTLVAVVLAMGGLAYAKPNALGELVQTALRSAEDAPKRGAGSRAVAPIASVAPVPLVAAPAGPAAILTAESPAVLLPPAKTVTPTGQVLARTPRSAAPTQEPPAAVTKANEAEPKARISEPQAQVSDWGRVGAALASGDEARAMAVLSELAESDDPRTRDKADLGRAQLMMSRGNREQACATARSLTNRRAGSRIERQAQALLKDCAR